MSFTPDYHNILDAACNRVPKRLPLYEHLISDKIMEQITGESFAHLHSGNDEELNTYFSHYCNFFKEMGYDTVSFECCAGAAMPGSGALGGHIKGVISDRKSFEEYPWDSIPERYFSMYHRDLEALRANMPEGMKAIGGVGNGIFECVQDLVGYEDLCYLAVDDPDLYQELFQKVGDTLYTIWKRFLEEYGDIYCVCRFGDDLGFKSTTLLSADDIKELIIPQYQRIISLVHDHQKPFLLHSCGCIFNIMDDLINVAKIDAKHSNEDQIARFPVWVERYGEKIGNFGGIDTDVLCRETPESIREYVLDVIDKCIGHGGFAFGSGNSIPDYVSPQGYLAMVKTVREYRGDF